MSFMATHLVGFGSGGAAALNPALSLVASRTEITDASSWSNSESLGTANATRRIIVALGWGSAAATTISALTVGGVSASEVVAIENTYDSVGCGAAIWIADVPTGTTGTVEITFSGSVARGGYSVFRVVNLDSATETDSDVDALSTAGVVTTTIDIPANGFAVAVASSLDPEPGTGVGSFSWNSGWTEQFDSGPLELENVFATATRSVTAAETGTTVTATEINGGPRSCLAVAAWGN